MIEAAVYDAKPYDRLYLEEQKEGVHWHFFEFRLSTQTAELAKGCDSFVSL